eukprot:scaffold19592_cov53-Phaeocystis_antarctica.AAC.3
MRLPRGLSKGGDGGGGVVVFARAEGVLLGEPGHHAVLRGGHVGHGGQPPIHGERRRRRGVRHRHPSVDGPLPRSGADEARVRAELVAHRAAVLLPEGDHSHGAQARCRVATRLRPARRHLGRTGRAGRAGRAGRTGRAAAQYRLPRLGGQLPPRQPHAAQRLGRVGPGEG